MSTDNIQALERLSYENQEMLIGKEQYLERPSNENKKMLRY